MDILQKLGFSEGESRVYQAILHSENATLQSIHEATGIERRNVYDIINKLISKGLAAYFIENGHKIYRLTSPKNILSYLDEEQKEIDEKKIVLEHELPALIRAHEAAKPEFDVRIYRGKEGIKSLYNEMLDYTDHYFIGGNWGIIKYVGREWWDRWDGKRIKKKIQWHDIITSKAKFLADQAPLKKYYKYKVLPPEFGSPNVILIFGNRTVNLYWGAPLLAIEVENDAIAKNYIAYFEYLWKTLKKG